jgi:hypothetical protein
MFGNETPRIFGEAPMQSISLDRRTILKGVATLAGLTLAPISSPAQAQTATVRVRSNVASPNGQAMLGVCRGNRGHAAATRA